MNRIICADIEANGLTPTKLYVMSCTELNPDTMLELRSWSLTDYNDIKELISQEDITWIIHYGHAYDKPVLEDLIGEFNGTMVCSLGLSFYLEPIRTTHGLTGYGEDFGVPKPLVEDWDDQDISVYINRCEQDVRIQTRLWKRQWKHLNLLYKDTEQIWHAVEVIQRKMRALAIADKSKWKLDGEAALELQTELESSFDTAKQALNKVMPQVPVYVWKTAPKKPFKKDGSPSTTGLRWQAVLKDNNLPSTHTERVKYLTGYKDPNSGSPVQIKDWLYSLGWKPELFNYERDKETNETKRIPQIKDTDKGVLCPNIIELAKTTPELNYLEDMSIIAHRKGVVTGFIKGADSTSCIVAGASGFTNTLRLRHRCAVNIPSIRKPFGKEIRSLLITKSTKKELVGADMCSLEDRIKMNYILPYDPEYVERMQGIDYDSHTNMAVAAGLITREEEETYKRLNALDELTSEEEALLKRLSKCRYIGKQVNYAATYGSGGLTISRAAGCTESEGDKLKAAYSNLNWAVDVVADNTIVKESRGMKWQWNPVANVWFYLKKDKDKYSTLAQGTASYVFDMWLDYILERRPQLCGQFHDEAIWEVRKGEKYREGMTKLLRDAMNHVNDSCNFKVKLDFDIQFGDNYAQIH